MDGKFMKMYYSIASLDGLTSNEKIILSEIIQLTTAKGCFASNEYFVRKFNVSKKTVTNALEHLESKCFIERRWIRTNDTFDKKFRVISILERTKKLLPNHLDLKSVNEIAIDGYGEIHTNESIEW